MKIIGLTRIRNEEKIIKDTLDHLSTYCNEIYIYDDASTDKTLEICRSHPNVTGIIECKIWEEERLNAETKNRQKLLELAQQNATENDWFVYIDADERIEFDWDILNSTKANAVKMKLFDFYITEEDKDKTYIDREWLGPEYREIIMAFKNSKELKYYRPIQREATLPANSIILYKGFVRHYGKAISIEEWEETCDYYIKYFEKYSAKWAQRKGKAIHSISDFGCKLIKWDEKELKGFPIQWVSGKKKKKVKLFLKRIQIFLKTKRMICL